MSEEDMMQRQQEEQYMQEQDYCRQLEGANHQLASENERLRGELAALREAMGPLVEHAKRFVTGLDGHGSDTLRVGLGVCPGYADVMNLRAVRAAVSAFDAAPR